MLLSVPFFSPLAQVEALLGPKTEADLVKPDKKKKPAAAPKVGGWVREGEREGQ